MSLQVLKSQNITLGHLENICIVILHDNWFKFKIWQIMFEPPHDNTDKMTSAPSEDA